MHRRAGSTEQGSPRGSAKDRALKLLAVRWRSRVEIERRLRQAGFEPTDVAAALDDLERAGLLDDERFARAVVRDRAGRRLDGSRAVRAALRASGVDVTLAEAVLAEEAGDDAERAAALARRRAPRLAGLPPESALRRLHGMLVRRGYSPSVAAEACRDALGEAETED